MPRNSLFAFFFISLTSAQLAFSQSAPADSMLTEANKLQGRQRIDLLLEYLDNHVTKPSALHRELLDEVGQWTKINGDTTDKLEFMLRKATFYTQQGLREGALTLARQVEMSNRATPTQHFRAAYTQRENYLRLGLFDKAIAIHTKLNWTNAHNIWEVDVPDNFLAFTYFKLGETKKAIVILKDCIQKVKEKNLEYWELSFTNSLGVMFEEAGNLDSAWLYYQSAKTMLEEKLGPHQSVDKETYHFIEGLINGNLAQIMAKRGDHLQAIPLYKFDISASLREPMGAEYRKNGIISLIKLSKSYAATGQYENAQKALDRAFTVLNTGDFPEEIQSYWKTRSSLFETMGRMDSALESAKTYMLIKDSIDQRNVKQRSQNLQIAYESGRKEQALEEREQELANLKIKGERERLLLNMLFFVSALLVLVLVIFYRAYKQRFRSEHEIAEKSQQIHEQSEVIKRSLEEKDLLLREVHHRVKNNLQIISSLFFLQSKNVKDEQARSIIQEGQSRVHVMSLIHQKLYQSNNLNTIDLQAYLSDLARQIIQTNRKPDLQIELTIEAKGIKQSVENAVPIGMIINELITNSIKHAFTGRKVGQVGIQLIKRGSMLRLEYSDDGHGIETMDSLEKKDSLGMKLIRLLSNQLEGAIEFDPSSGFKVSIEFDAKQ